MLLPQVPSGAESRVRGSLSHRNISAGEVSKSADLGIWMWACSILDTVQPLERLVVRAPPEPPHDGQLGVKTFHCGGWPVSWKLRTTSSIWCALSDVGVGVEGPA